MSVFEFKASKIISIDIHVNGFIASIPATDHQSAAPSDITKIGEEYVEQKFEKYSFPRTNQRRFQPNWIQKCPWIEYSVQRDAVFCYPCRQFSTSSAAKNPDLTFTVTGFRAWAAALQNQKGFARHERSNYHLNAVLSWKDNIARKKQNKDISTLLSNEVLALRKYYAESILDIVTFLASNELAFRGNWDMDALREDGLFQSMFEYTMRKDDKLRKSTSIIPQNAKYTSPEIQNELIASAVACTQRSIVDLINSSKCFALYVDGTKDRNGVECIVNHVNR